MGGDDDVPARFPWHPNLEQVNRLLTEQSQDNVRNRILIGQYAGTIYSTGLFVGTGKTFILARYPYNPSLHVWTQMHIYIEVDEADVDSDVDFEFGYTLNDGASFTTLTLTNSGDTICGALWREAVIDLTGLTNATWIGLAVRVTGLDPAERTICRSVVFLERPGF